MSDHEALIFFAVGGIVAFVLCFVLGVTRKTKRWNLIWLLIGFALFAIFELAGCSVVVSALPYLR